MGVIYLYFTQSILCLNQYMRDRQPLNFYQWRFFSGVIVSQVRVLLTLTQYYKERGYLVINTNITPETPRESVNTTLITVKRLAVFVYHVISCHTYKLLILIKLPT